MAGDQLVSLSRLEGLLGRSRVELRALADEVERHYRPFHLHDTWGLKKSDRHIDDPDPELKVVQRAIKRLLHGIWRPPHGMFGAVAERSLLHNANVHAGRRVLVTVDIRRCFPSISNLVVCDALRRLVGASETAKLLTKLVTVNFHLPQGAPTSPILANIVLQPAFDALQAEGRRIGVLVSSWIDDFAFSGARARELVDLAYKEFGALGLTIARDKVKIFRSHREAMELTKLVLNRRPSGGRHRAHAVAAIRVAAEPGATHWEVLRARGIVNFVKSINSRQGARLERFAARVLPPQGLPGARPPRRFVKVTCNCRDGRRIMAHTAAPSREPEKVS